MITINTEDEALGTLKKLTQRQLDIVVRIEVASFLAARITDYVDKGRLDIIASLSFVLNEDVRPLLAREFRYSQIDAYEAGWDVVFENGDRYKRWKAQEKEENKSKLSTTSND